MGSARDPHRVIWDCLKAAVNFCNETSFPDKRNYFIPQIVLSSDAVSVPANCPQELVRVKKALSLAFTLLTY